METSQGLHRDPQGLFITLKLLVQLLMPLSQFPVFQVPHAFQQLLSNEKTPTLHNAFPCFRAMVLRWRKLSEERPVFAEIINPGIEKLEDYMSMMDTIPAYTLAICEQYYSASNLCLIAIPVINPAYKLRWFEHNMRSKVSWARSIFYDAVSPPCQLM